MIEEIEFHQPIAKLAAECTAFLEQAFAGKPEGSGLRASRRSLWMRVNSLEAESCDRRAGTSLLQFRLPYPQIDSWSIEKSILKHPPKCMNRSPHSHVHVLSLGQRRHTMKTVIQISPRDSAKAWALLVRHSPGAALPDRTFVVSDEAARASKSGHSLFGIVARGQHVGGQRTPLLQNSETGVENGIGARRNLGRQEGRRNPAKPSPAAQL
jgi:hypothetical protein